MNLLKYSVLLGTCSRVQKIILQKHWATLMPKVVLHLYLKAGARPVTWGSGAAHDAILCGPQPLSGHSPAGLCLVAPASTNGLCAAFSSEWGT